VFRYNYSECKFSISVYFSCHLKPLDYITTEDTDMYGLRGPCAL
jgi:hypothetical protein